VKAFDWPDTGPRPLNILCLGAHCDDIEIGCGATLLTLLSQREATVHWEIFSGSADREAECRRSAEQFLADAKSWELRCHRHRDGYLPYVGAAVKDDFEALKAKIDPDIIFTHTSEDLHQDHRLVQELTWNTFRRHTILEFEIPKVDGDLGRPNVYVPVSEEAARRKSQILLDAYTTQSNKPWFDAEVFGALLRIRGMEAEAPSRKAEGFFGRKMTLQGA
jgi:LmbE family N-acetylglucosaminyl deacetylase